MTPQPILLDVDTGVDDALAIMLALRSPEVRVVGITTVSGNVAVEACTRNSLFMLDHLTAGMIVADHRRQPRAGRRVQVCTGVDVERFTRLSRERVLDEPPEG